jgi:hypothetical protein
VHYANATDTTQKTPGPASVAANVHTTSIELLEPASFHAGRTLDLRVCPGETITWTGRCKFPEDCDRTIIAANGHFHERGKRFTVSVLDPEDFDRPLGDPGKEPFYESLSWDDATMATGLEIQVPAGGGVEFSCEYVSRPSDAAIPTTRAASRGGTRLSGPRTACCSPT